MIVRQLDGELGEILRMPDIRDGFARQGADPAGGTPEEYEAFTREESARWRDVVRQAGIKPE